MSKKIFYTCITIILDVLVNCLLIVNQKFNILIFIISLIFYLIFTFGLFYPEKLFRFTHWYLNKDLYECQEIFISIYKFIIVMAMLLSILAPIYQLAPIEINF